VKAGKTLSHENAPSPVEMTRTKAAYRERSISRNGTEKADPLKREG
jgi:hypothetical protein